MSAWLTANCSGLRLFCSRLQELLEDKGAGTTEGFEKTKKFIGQEPIKTAEEV
jgi:hypothetical protein